MAALGSTRAEAQPKGALRPGLSELSSDLVFSASKRLQRVQEAPGVVHAVTRRQIVRAGYRDMVELLGAIPEIEIVDTGRNQFALVKGVPFTIRVLLNGVALNNYVDQWVYLRQLPLEIVRKVEVVLSPGSVLWGAHAMLGVVNIITRGRAKAPVSHTLARGGSFETLRLAHTLSFEIGELRARAHVHLQTTRGPSLSLESHVLAPGRLTSGGETANSAGLGLGAFASLSWRGLFVQAFSRIVDEQPYGINERTGALQQPGALTRLEVPTTLVSAAYQRRWSWTDASLRLLAKAYLFNQRYRDHSFAYAPSSAVPGGVETITRIDNQLRLGASVEVGGGYRWWNGLLGVDAFRASTSNINARTIDRSADSTETRVDAVGAWTLSLYSQHELRPHRDVNLAAGVRWTGSQSFDQALVLHGHAVYEPIDGIFIKANYSEGYRPPTFEQSFSASSSAIGSTDLLSERARVLEGQLDALVPLAQLLGFDPTTLRLRLGAGYAYGALSDLVGAGPSLPRRFENLGTLRRHTLSAFLQLRIGELATLHSALAHHVPLTEADGSTRRDFARTRLTTRLMVKPWRLLTLSLEHRFTSGRRIERFAVSNASTDVGGYHQLWASARMRLWRSGLSVTLSLRNLLARDYDHVAPYTTYALATRLPFPQHERVFGFVSLEYALAR